MSTSQVLFLFFLFAIAFALHCSSTDLDVKGLLLEPSSGPSLPIAVPPELLSAALPIMPSPFAEMPVFPPTSPAYEPGYLVWTRNAHGDKRTHRLDDRGVELESIPGVLIATEDGVWEWREERHDVPTQTCEASEEVGSARPHHRPAPGHATLSKLVLQGGEVEQRIVEPAQPAEEEGGLRGFDHRVELIGSVGPFLFVTESTYAYGCGAHGNTESSSMVWDAARRGSIDWANEVGAVEGPRQVATALLEEDDDPFPPGDDDLELTELVPKFGFGAALRFGLQMTASTCYACSRGGWSSYTKSVVVDAPVVPKRFALYLAAPSAVRSFAEGHSDLRLGGWSAQAAP